MGGGTATARTPVPDGAASPGGVPGAARSAATHASPGATVPLPAAVRAVEALRFPGGIASLSAGPGDGDLAVSGYDQVDVVRGGRLVKTIPLAQDGQWVPSGDWIVYARTDAPTIQGVRVIGYRAAQIGGGGATLDLAPCASLPQVLPGPAVAFSCQGVLEIAALKPSGLGTPRTYTWTSGLRARLTVDPTRRLVAAVGANGWVTAHRLVDGKALPGTFMAAAPNGPAGLAWSGSGVLAVAWPAGFALWQPGVRVVLVPSAAYDDRIRWLADGSGLVAATSFSPASAPAGHLVGLDGRSRAVIPPSREPVLGFSAGGRYYWRPAPPPAGPGAPPASAASAVSLQAFTWSP